MECESGWKVNRVRVLSYVVVKMSSDTRGVLSPYGDERNWK